MQLTPRQKSFLSRLLELYRERRQPLHYTEVARRLGLGKSSAYEMLRLLERKGQVLSEYLLPKGDSSPGRSHILFQPTAEALEAGSPLLVRADGRDEEWEQFKARVLSKLQSGKASARKGVLRQVMDIIPEAQSPLALCAEVITVLLLNLKDVKHGLEPRTPLAKVLESPATKLGMSLAAGLAAGMVQMDVASRRALDRLNDYVKRYEASLDGLNTEDLEALRRYALDVVTVLRLRKS